MSQCLLAEAKLPKMFWLRAATLTSVRVRNSFPTSSNEKRLSPTEMNYWENIKAKLLAYVWMPGILSRSRQWTEIESKWQEKQVHWLGRREQNLLADGSRDKTSGVSKKRETQRKNFQMSLWLKLNHYKA